MAMGNLTTLEAVKDYLKLTTSDFDDLLESWITAMSVWAQKTRMQRVIAESSYSKTFMGTGQSVFAFSDWPALSVVSVIIGTVTLTYLTDYWWVDDQLVLVNGNTFVPGVKCQVNWTAGYAETPADLDQATIECVALLYRERDRLGESSKTIGGAETVAFDTSPGTKRALATFDAYRKVYG